MTLYRCPTCSALTTYTPPTTCIVCLQPIPAGAACEHHEPSGEPSEDDCPGDWRDRQWAAMQRDIDEQRRRQDLGVK